MILLAFLLGLVVGVALCGALFLAACYVEARAVATPPPGYCGGCGSVLHPGEWHRCGGGR
mgnify:FL=1